MKGEKRFVPILILFWALRLMTLATFPPQDLMDLGDYQYYYDLAQFSDRGLLPFIDYWSEYPPLFPFLSTGLYRVSRLLLGGDFKAYAYLLAGVMTALDCGSLVLFLRLARCLWGEQMAERLGWTYAILFVTLIFSFWTFEPLTTFFMLLAVTLLLDGKDEQSAVIVGLGALTKLIPLLLIPAAMLVRPWRKWLLYGLVVAVVVSSVTALLIGVGGEVAVASFRTVLRRNSYETIWALVDGNLTSGMVGSPQEHLNLENAAGPPGNPARVPGWLKTVPFALLGLFVFLQASVENSPRGLVAFVALTLVIFFLWSKGWSPQWQLFLFPLILLTLPYRRAFFFVVALSFVNFVECPLFLARDINYGLYLTVPLRTVLFVVLGLDLWRQVEADRSLPTATLRS